MRTQLLAAALLVLVSVQVSPAPARPPGVATSLRDGIAVLEAAVAAVGGRQALDRLNQVAFELSGETANPVQGHDPAFIDRPAPDGRFRVRSLLDDKGGRFIQETTQDLAGGFSIRSATDVRDGTAFTMQFGPRRFSRTTGPGASPEALIQTAARYFPALALRRALVNRAATRWLREEVIGSLAADVIEISWSATTRYELTIRRIDRAVTRLVAWSSDPLSGDAESELSYSGRQLVDGLVLPARVALVRHGRRVLDLAIGNVAFGAAAVDVPFGPPEGFVESPAAGVQTREAAAGLVEIAGFGGGQYRAFAIDIGDSVVVFDALLGYPVSAQVLGVVAKAFPGKRVSKVVISHFHADHASGVGAFIESGATVVTTAGSEDVLTRYANARSVLLGQSLPATPLQPRFETVERIATLDSARTIEVHRLSTPHVKDMLLVFDTRTGTVINGDLFSEVTPFNPTFLVLADWLEARKTGVTRIVGTHHPELAVADFLARASVFRKATSGR